MSAAVGQGMGDTDDGGDLPGPTQTGPHPPSAVHPRVCRPVSDRGDAWGCGNAGGGWWPSTGTLIDVADTPDNGEAVHPGPTVVGARAKARSRRSGWSDWGECGTHVTYRRGHGGCHTAEIALTRTRLATLGFGQAWVRHAAARRPVVLQLRVVAAGRRHNADAAVAGQVQSLSCVVNARCWRGRCPAMSFARMSHSIRLWLTESPPPPVPGSWQLPGRRRRACHRRSAQRITSNSLAASGTRGAKSI
jgi:hypothetical protein